jgi:hypothetical protein
VTFFYGEAALPREGVRVGVAKTTSLHVTIDGGEKIYVESGRAPVDTDNPGITTTIDSSYLKYVPTPGRYGDDAIGLAPGTQGDQRGVMIAGGSSLETPYYVDGVDTTGLQFGAVGTPILNNFLEEIEIATGGYGAEFGRSTGGIVQQVTKAGGNEFKGSAWVTYRDHRMMAGVKRTPIQGASIDATTNLSYETDFGFELGGPIVKDKLWFYVGAAPTLVKYTTTRRTKSRTDCRVTLDSGALSPCDPELYGDGQPDQDPTTGYYITDDIAGGSRDVSSTGQGLQLLGKLNFNVTPKHSGQLSFIAGRAGASTAASSACPARPRATTPGSGSTSPGAGCPSSTTIGPRSRPRSASTGPRRAPTRSTTRSTTPGPRPCCSRTSASCRRSAARATPRARAAWTTTPDPNNPDPYPLIENCPDEGVGYAIGGPGALTDDYEERRSAKLTVSHRLSGLLGEHVFKGGVDVQDQTMKSTRVLSGGAAITNYANRRGADYIRIARWVQLAPPGSTDPRFDSTCRNGEDTYVCDFLGGEIGDPGTEVVGKTLNWSAFLQDSWQPRPHITINAGLRYDEQRLRYAEDLQGTVDALTGNALGKNAMTLTGMFAPRLGVVYDWTKVAKGKLFGHWGRFYESVPMQINDRSFGGEVFDYSDFISLGDDNQCGPTVAGIGAPDGNGCLVDPTAVPGKDETLFGTSGVLVAPGIKAQYVDEALAGVQYEVAPDLALMVSYQNRRMGRVIEDVSTDGADTYIIANPGEWSAGDEARLERQIAQTDDEDERARLEHQLELFRGIRAFDAPRRDYDALQFTLTRRFSKEFQLQASYTYSKNQGNYPGLLSYDNGQVDPNISSQYDLIELLANRDGMLSQDRPNYVKVDGYYTFDLKRQGSLVLGGRVRALSGTPINALAPHYSYGGDESFLLPRGQLGRTDFDVGVDLKVTYARPLGRGMTLSVFADLSNLLNRQAQASVDESYALAYPGNNANPISGGTYEDLVWVKRVNDDGFETPDPIERNPNFRNTAGRYAPLFARFGAELTF